MMSVLVVLPALAAGGSRQPPPTPSEPGSVSTLSPEEQANLHYNDGLKARDKAWELEKKAEDADEPKQRDKYNRKAQKQFEKAIDSFTDAVRLQPDFYQAHSDLGYALRRTGRYQEALAAYDRALAVNGAYTEAIEYRAEAYLKLDRLEEAKGAYIVLAGSDRPRADILIAAMNKWVGLRRDDPGPVGAEEVERFAAWVRLQEETAGKRTSAPKGGNW
jgi:tetratricopeptide (TPR) repeat protein